jgi:5-methyltetrahydrofolate--homocysteine methyltransferase
VSLEEARKNRFDGGWRTYTPPNPCFTGTQTLLSYPLAELVDYIDWQPFFYTWELYKRYPEILQDPEVGETATSLYNDALAMLSKLTSDGRLQANATFGFWPANSQDETVVLYTDESRATELCRWNFLRQQMPRGGKDRRDPKQCHLSLADFVAPVDLGVPDYVGAFVVTSGVGLEAIAAEYEAANDDYNSILVKALADRLAEAFAERLHQRVRTEFWGYASDETLAAAELVHETYRGIRPAPGYPACPVHEEKSTLFKLLDATNTTEVRLTESYAMYPAAAVCGYYFSHPQSCYFGVKPMHENALSPVV